MKLSSPLFEGMPVACRSVWSWAPWEVKRCPLLLKNFFWPLVSDKMFSSGRGHQSSNTTEVGKLTETVVYHGGCWFIVTHWNLLWLSPGSILQCPKHLLPGIGACFVFSWPQCFTELLENFPQQYCLIVYSQTSPAPQLGSRGTEGVQDCKHKQLSSQSFVTASIFCGGKHNTCSPLGDALPLHKRHCPHCLRQVMSQRLWPSSYIVATTWAHLGPADQVLQGLVLLEVVPAGAPVYCVWVGQREALLFCTE